MLNGWIFWCTSLQSHCRSSWPILCSLAHCTGKGLNLFNLNVLSTCTFEDCTLARTWIFSLLVSWQLDWVSPCDLCLTTDLELGCSQCHPIAGHVLQKTVQECCRRCHFVTQALQVETLDWKSSQSRVVLQTVEECFLVVWMVSPLSLCLTICKLQCKQYCDLVYIAIGWKTTNSQAFADSVEGVTSATSALQFQICNSKSIS